MNRDKNKLLDILTEHFPDDPTALKRVHIAIKRQYEKELQDANEKTRAELRAEHKKGIEKVSKDLTTQLTGAFREHVGEMIKSFSATLKQEVSAARASTLDEVKEHVDKKYGKDIEVLKSKSRTLENTTERHRNSIERFSEFAVGAPNRSVYLNGALISPYYSDLNIVPGPGITMTPSSDEVNHQAKLTITATASGTGLNPQTPVGTVNSVNKTFTCTGIVSVAIADGTVDVGAVISGATNSTITYSVPPQNNVYAF